MSMDEKTVATIKPDVLTPAETEQKLETIGVTKANMPMIRAIPLGILAGIFIGMGGMMLGLVLGDSANIPFIAQRLLGGFGFCIGLILVLLAGAELFTGNNLIIAAVLSGKVSWGAYIKNLIIIWVTNLIGSLIAVAVVFLANTGAMGATPGAVGDAFINLAAMKATIPPVTLFFKAILCNFLVCLAVWMSFAGRTFVDKFFAILFPITAFVAAGAEHSVANMFFLPMGYVLKLTGSAVGEKALESAGNLDIGGIAYNLGMVTLGNIIGGALLVGVMYWIAFHKKKEA
ncbi:MAG: formate/nitrite transporter family protein [Coriobacteriales bacterium]|nr:formate/nitrite transporter family protein [Coriobacteriales bacterium]